MDIKLSQSQSQTLSLSMRTSLHLLQLNTMDLREYICEVMLNNPLIELVCPEIDSIPSPFEKYRSKPVVEYDSQNPQDFWDKPIPDKAKEAESLHELYLQAAYMNLSALDSHIIKYLIQSLDDNGFFTDNLEDTAKLLNVSFENVNRCLELLKSMEPAGVGAADLKECLSLQIKRSVPSDAIALEIIHSFLEQLSKKQFAAIAKALNVSKAEVVLAYDKIHRLNPKPLNGLSGESVTYYIVPDFYIFTEGDQISYTINDYYLPKITIDPTYRKLLNDKTLNAKDKEYLLKNYKSASDMAKFISFRKSTLQRVIEYVIDIQKDFFLLGPQYQHPLSNKEAAQFLNLHDSTVSRAVSGKFFECKWGIFPLKSLFSHSIGSNFSADNSLSAAQAQMKVKSIIDSEPSGHAYSDQSICDIMQSEGIYISRRTIAKYRKKLGIPSASKRNAKFSR